MKRTVMVLVFAGILLGGCDNTKLREALTTARTTAETFDGAVDDLKEKKAAVDEAIADMPDGPQKDEALAVSNELGQWIGRYDAGKRIADKARADLEARLATAEDRIAAAEAVGLTAAPFAGPYAPLVALVVSLGAATWRMVRNGKRAKAGEGVVRALERVKNGGNAIDFSDPATAKKLSDVMGKAGKALVDKIQME